MIEVRFTQKFKICIDFTFFAVIALFLSFDGTGYGLMSIAACLVHESGHLIAMLIQKKFPSKLTFYGGGIKLSSSVQPSVFVLLAGSFTNFIVFGILYFNADGTDIFPVLFAVLNLIIGIFNLLPISFFDGKILLETLLIHTLEPVIVMKILNIIQFLILFLIIYSSVFMFFNGFINFTVAIVLIYLIFVDIIDKI